MTAALANVAEAHVSNVYRRALTCRHLCTLGNCTLGHAQAEPLPCFPTRNGAGPDGVCAAYQEIGLLEAAKAYQDQPAAIPRGTTANCHQNS